MERSNRAANGVARAWNGPANFLGLVRFWFAAGCSCPPALVTEAVTAYGGTPLVDSQVSELAATFNVSEQAMTIRLSTLGLL